MRMPNWDLEQRPGKVRPIDRATHYALINCSPRTAHRWSLWPSNFERDPDTAVVVHKDAVWLKPTAHTYYGTRVADIQDDLPKWEGVPNDSKRMSVSGQVID